MSLKILPLKPIYEKMTSMLKTWNNTLEDSVKYQEIVFQEVIEVKEGNLYFNIDSIELTSYGAYRVIGNLFKDFNAKTISKNPNVILFDVLNDNEDDVSYIETEDNYTIDSWSETNPHTRVLSIGFSGVIVPDEITIGKILKIGYNLEEQEAF